jgi:hypothetical protein
MAGDWIKMRVDLPTSPKVVRIASALKADRLRVVGGLHAVWSLFDVHAEDGRLDGYTTTALDSWVGFDGLGAAMVAVGWLEEGADFLVAPRFDKHNGQSAKRRATETERKREARKVSALDADKVRTREEKRREEKTSTDVEVRPAKTKTKAAAQKPSDATATAAQKPPDVTDAVWQDFLALRKAHRAPLTQTALNGIGREANKAGITLTQALSICCERGWRCFNASWKWDGNQSEQARGDLARMTVPGSNMPDPALEKIKRDAQRAVPPPAHIREQMKSLRRVM